MKKDLSQENNPQKRKEQKAPEELDLTSYQSFSKDEEDEDFEILDALEHMEQTGMLEEEQVAEGDKMIELTLDDDDLILDEEDVEGDESGFRFDEQMSAGLEQELLGPNSDFDLDESVEFETGDTEFEKEAFVLDLNQEDEQQSFDVSLETEAEMEDTDFSLPDEELAFDLNEEEEEILGFMPRESEVREEEAEEFRIELEDEQFSENESEDVGFEETTENASAEEMDLMDFDLGQQDESFDEPEDQNEAFETEHFDEEEKLEDMVEGIDIAEGFADLEADIDLEDEQLSAQEFSDMDFESEPDEFAGKPVITVGDDQVIDLGDTDLDQEEDFDFSADSWKKDGMDTTKMFGMSPDEEQETTEEHEEEPLDSEFDFDTGESGAEASQEEEFMTSFDDIDIDLEAEATKMLEEAEDFDQFDVTEESSDTEAESEEDFDLDLHEEEESEADALESFDLAEKPTDLSLSEEMSEEPSEEEAVEEDDTRFVSESILEAEAKPEPENVQEQAEAEIESAEFLEVSLRLTPPQMEEFEGMISEAKTLQKYLDELETHKANIKEKIYQKLRDEYITRQKDIFSAPAFTTLFTDVKEDLQEMQTKHAEFVATVERLNEELEEITVRHLVGEYDEATLHEKESSQKAEIEIWNQKTEKIHQVITRYQDILETEEALNPLRQEAAIASPDQPQREEEIVAPLSSEQPESSPEEEFFEDESVNEDFLQADEQIEEEGLAEEIPEFEETDEDVFGISEEEQLEEDFDFEALSKVAEELVDETSEEEEEEEREEEPQEFEEETPQEDMISCKKCGRQTPASDKFCIHCGAKAR